jgi:hypothetical protein
MSIATKRILMSSVIIAIILIAVWYYHYNSYLLVRTTKYNHTQVTLNNVCFIITQYYLRYDKLPEPRLNNISASIKTLQLEDYIYPETRELLSTGKDVWGHSIIIEQVSDKIMRIRSIGENGIDDNGEGDDIQREVDVGELSMSR